MDQQNSVVERVVLTNNRCRRLSAQVLNGLCKFLIGVPTFFKLLFQLLYVLLKLSISRLKVRRLRLRNLELLRSKRELISQRRNRCKERKES